MAIILLCLKIKSSKSNPDLYGVEGTVKNKTDDGYHAAGASNGNTSDNKLNVSGDDSRCEVRTPSYDRKLPEIPNNDDIYKNSSTKDDNSELYATVDEVPANNILNSRSDLLPVAAGSSSNFDSKNHPYAKVKKTRRQEHPYAKVGESKDQDDNTDTEEYDTTENLLQQSTAGHGQRSSGRSASGPSSWRRPDHAQNNSRQSTPLPPEPAQYPPDPGHGQQHFSGDSQDSFSAKGYTSISVREPLAMIRDIRAGGAAPVQEGNYVTLSETSDEMYAAIEDTVYMNPAGKDSHEKEEDESDPNNMYSKVDKVKKKHNRETKSYDASNPYATVNKPSVSKNMSQSSDNLGARPKHRSPRPSGHNTDTVDYSDYEVNHSDRRSRGAGPPLFNMARSEHEFRGHRPDPNYETLPAYAESGVLERDPGYEMLQHTGGGHSIGHQTRGRDPHYETVNSEVKDPGYEVVSHQRHRVNSIDPGYETVPQKRDPGYETVNSRDPNYETVKSKDPGYESVKAPGSTLDPGYETVQPSSRSKHSSSSYGPRSYPAEYETRDPGYESVGGMREPGYETVKSKRSVSLEPGYEMLPDTRTRVEDHSDMYSVVNKKQRAAPAARLPSVHQDSEEEGYETIPADKRKDSRSSASAYDPGYEELPPPLAHIQSSGAGAGEYETISKKQGDSITEDNSDDVVNDAGYARLKDADIEYIDESGEDELEDSLSDLKPGEKKK